MLRYKFIKLYGDICTVEYYPEDKKEYGIIEFSLSKAEPISHDPRGIQGTTDYLMTLQHLRKCAKGERDIKEETIIAWY